MGYKIFCMGKVALVLLGEVPVVGPQISGREKALRVAQKLFKEVDKLIAGSSAGPYQIIFKHKGSGRYDLVIKSSELSLVILHDLDELWIKRFRKIFNGIFILSCFYEKNNNLECLAVTEGLGAVLYSSEIRQFFQTR
ncbi:MAG TPA: hypothetical protein DCK76_04100 [Desulfotomaculum sp.]|nr:MAG: Uncharacterized protein XD84_0641 [Desulfotomaculum sp. 46_80]KUK85312.1 MAG: Uncharacterized protein XE00_0024 [Desulfofundulus kuznetsovii]HAG10568.1 hypothetical protein [Desulfotomaculum sp.]HBY03459.1 hypothetical protein [Desulfotomaculum sp.]